ncbi:hypothetical protein H632_c1537p0, partial [Helicosporidium sp. ATCC 50920]
MVDLSGARALLQQLQTSYDAGDLDKAKAALDRLKVELLRLPGLPPQYSGPEGAVREQLLLGRQTQELSFLLSVSRGDEAGAARAWACLKPYYSDARRLLGSASAQEARITSLRLLSLLLSRRGSDFCCELEALPAEVAASPAVAHTCELEAWLAEGSYNRVLAAATGGDPDPVRAALLRQLLPTVRNQVAACVAASCEAVTLSQLAALLRLDSEDQARRAALERGWEVHGQGVRLARGGGAGG